MLLFIVLVIELTILSIIKYMGTLSIDNTFASFLILLFSIALIIYIQKNNVFKKYSTQIIIGYLIRVFLLYFDLYGRRIYVLLNSGSDSEMFYRTSTELVLYGKTNRDEFFIRLMARVFRLIGINRLFGQFLLMLLSIVAIMITVLIINGLTIKFQIKSLVVLVLCTLPNFAILSSLFLRESIVVLLISSSMFFLANWINGGSIFQIIASLVVSIVACVFHTGAIGITIGCIVCLMLYDHANMKIQFNVIGILLALFIALGVSFLFLNYSEMLMSRFVNVDSIKDVANMETLGGSSYAKYVGNSDTPINMIIYSLPRMFYFLFSPFPWQWRGISDIIAFFLSGSYYLYSVVSIIRYLKTNCKHNLGLVVCFIILAFFTTFIFAWGVSNTGTAARHRDKMVTLYAVILALTMSKDSATPEKSQSRYIR